MGEHHGVDQADAPGEPCGAEVGEGVDQAPGREERAEDDFLHPELAEEPVGEQGARNEGPAEAVQGEEGREFGDDFRDGGLTRRGPGAAAVSILFVRKR